MPAESTYCGPCGADHVRHAAVVQAAIVALWGSAGLDPVPDRSAGPAAIRPAHYYARKDSTTINGDTQITVTGNLVDECRQLTFDDVPAAQNRGTIATVASLLTADLARITVRVTEFWRNVSTRAPGECWPWTGYLNEDGYGEFFFTGKMYGAHELAVTFSTGEIRDSGAGYLP